MTDLRPTLQAAVGFLRSEGFDEGRVQEEVQDGHWLLRWCLTHINDGLCPCNVELALKNLFTKLEDGSYIDGTPLISGESGWTRADTNAALEAGGFPKWDDA